ncbi:myomegalin isoform X12 [Podarcis muralis]
MRSEGCRVCGRALCGTHRRWLFHGASGAPPSPAPPPSRPSLQVLLAHATGREVSRDGRAEFACGKCAFLLERVYRFDTVIARVEALSLERLQRLLLEKERLKLCLAALYRRTNGAPEAPPPEGQPGGGAGAWDARYLALLQEDFAFSGLECWAEGEARADEQPPGAPRRCRGCAALRVADADYEAVCRVPRRAAPKSAGQPQRPGDGESLDDEAAEADGRRRAEEAGSSSLESLASGPAGGGLAAALSLLKAFGCKPVRSPRGSRLPVPARRSPEGAAGAPSEAPQLRELWEELCADYVPLRPKYLFEDQQQLTPNNLSQGKQASELNNVELLEKISCLDATNKQLQAKLNEMDFELKSVQHTSQRQDHKIQTLNETLKSKEKESEELYRVIEGQNETIAKLQDTLHKTQLGQLQIPGGSSVLQQTQPVALLELQNTLFFTQLEVQQLKTAHQKKDLQLAEATKTSCLVETWLQEEQQQKEAAWKHNQELRCALQQVRTELQNKNWQCCTLERERWSEMQKQELKLKHLKHRLACREQLLQESKELIQYHQSLDKSPTSADNMVKKLQQRIKDRDAILERAIDEKFCVLEDKEQELQQLRLAVKEREHDLEELRRVLSHNEATIQGMESLLKAKGLELEQLLTSYQNLRWLKEEVEAKSLKWQAEQEGTIRQLQAALQDRNKKVEALSAKLLCKLGPGQRELVEELYLCLQQKEQIIEELLSDKSRQTVEQMAELQELLQAVHTREQQSCISSEKMARALIERSCELQDLRQQLQGQLSQEKMEASTAHLLQKDDSEALRQESSSKSPTTMTSKNGDGHFNVKKGAWGATAGLEEELTGAKEQLELLTQKEKESRLELAALQSVLVSQEEELQVQASDVESLTRSIQIKEELIKDLQMQLVDPEEMPVVERLSQEVLMLQEKVAKMEQQGQEVAENRRLQLLQVLEGLAAEKNQLNETLKAEKQLYSTWVKFQAHPDSLASSQHEQTLQVELDRVQAIRGQLEEALGRSLAHLSRLESLDGIGGGEQERVTVLPKHAF